MTQQDVIANDKGTPMFILITSYLVSAIIAIAITVRVAKRDEATWGELLATIGLSLIPILNTLIAGYLIYYLVADTGILDRKVFK